MRIPVSVLVLFVSIVGLAAEGCGGGPGTGTSGGGGAATTVTVTLKGAAPAAVATKIGSGAFTAASPTGGALTIALPAGTSSFGFAVACPPQAATFGGIQLGQLTQQTVFEATTADGTAFTAACPQTLPGGSTTGLLTGSFDASAVPAVSYVQIAAQNSIGFNAIELPLAKSAFSFAAPAGSDRVEALAYSSSLSGLPFGESLAAAKNFDNQTVPGSLNGGNPAVFTAADEAILQPITYNNVPAGYAAPSTNVTFAMGGTGAFSVALAAGSSYPALPAAAVKSGDSYIFFATAHQLSVGGLGVGPYVIASSTSSTAGPMAFTFPAPWTYGGPTPAALPTFNFNYAGFAGKSGVTNGVSLLWTTGTSSINQNVFSLEATPSYLTGSAELAFPDLSGITGFIAAPSPGTSVLWTAEVAQNSNGLVQGGAAGSNWVAVANSGSFKVP